jgi:hypothetical protein
VSSCNLSFPSEVGTYPEANGITLPQAPDLVWWNDSVAPFVLVKQGKV